MIIGVLVWGVMTKWWTVTVLTIIFILFLAIFIGTNGRKIWPIVFILPMIPAIKKKLEALRKFQDEAQERVIEQVRKNEPFVFHLVTEEQLFRGVDAGGRRIAPPYRPFTVQIKRARNQPTDRVTLLDTGDFYGAMDVRYDPDKFFVLNTDRKSAKLRAKYGSGILGLNDQSIELLTVNIKPDLQDDFKNTVL